MLCIPGCTPQVLVSRFEVVSLARAVMRPNCSSTEATSGALPSPVSCHTIGPPDSGVTHTPPTDQAANFVTAVGWCSQTSPLLDHEARCFWGTSRALHTFYVDQASMQLQMHNQTIMMPNRPNGWTVNVAPPAQARSKQSYGWHPMQVNAQARSARQNSPQVDLTVVVASTDS